MDQLILTGIGLIFVFSSMGITYWTVSKTFEKNADRPMIFLNFMAVHALLVAGALFSGMAFQYYFGN